MVRLTKDVGCGLTVSVEGELFTEAFEKMSMIEDVFRMPTDKNGNPTVENFQLRTRTVDDNTYYELFDPKTRAKLALGQYKKPKEGWLFPKRKDKDGNWLENSGWEVWQGNKAAETEKPAADATGKKAKSKDTGF